MARKQQTRACKKCGLMPLVWGKLNGTSWRLFTEQGELHECPMVRKRAPRESVVDSHNAAIEARAPGNTYEVTRRAEAMAAAITAQVQAQQTAIPSHFASDDTRRADYTYNETTGKHEHAPIDGNAALYALIRQYVAADVASALTSAFADFTPAKLDITGEVR